MDASCAFNLLFRIQQKIFFQGTSVKKIRSVYDVNYTNRTIQEALKTLNEKAAATVMQEQEQEQEEEQGEEQEQEQEEEHEEEQEQEQEQDGTPAPGPAPQRKRAYETFDTVFDTKKRPAGLLV